MSNYNLMRLSLHYCTVLYIMLMKKPSHPATVLIVFRQRHFSTDGHSLTRSWFRAPSVTHYQIFVVAKTVAVLS